MTKILYRLVLILGFTYLPVLLLIAFWPTPVDQSYNEYLHQFIGSLHKQGLPKFIGYYEIEFAANVALFVPLGYISAAGLKNPFWGVLIGFASSVFIESGQAMFLPNRFPESRDIIANTMGAVLGMAVLVVVQKRHAKTTNARSSELVAPNQSSAHFAPLDFPEVGDLSSMTPKVRIRTSANMVHLSIQFPRYITFVIQRLGRLSKTIFRMSDSQSKRLISSILTIGIIALLIVGASIVMSLTPTKIPQTPSVVVTNGEQSRLPTPSSTMSSFDPTASPSPAPTLPSKKPTAAFIGDGYSGGLGASSKAAGWAEILAHNQKWLPRNFSNKGTGYASFLTADAALEACGKDRCPPYGELVQQVIALQPSIVVVSGGRNDIWRGNTATADKIDELYRDLADGLPNAKIIAINPTWGTGLAPDSFDFITEQVKRSANSIGARFINIGQPLQGRPDRVVQSGDYPNNVGHKAIAEAIMAALDPSHKK